jgi:hypothetical protein
MLVAKPIVSMKRNISLKHGQIQRAKKAGASNKVIEKYSNELHSLTTGVPS